MRSILYLNYNNMCGFARLASICTSIPVTSKSVFIPQVFIPYPFAILWSTDLQYIPFKNKR